jgi:hypothetical protein
LRPAKFDAADRPQAQRTVRRTAQAIGAIALRWSLQAIDFFRKRSIFQCTPSGRVNGEIEAFDLSSAIRSNRGTGATATSGETCRSGSSTRRHAGAGVGPLLFGAPQDISARAEKKWPTRLDLNDARRYRNRLPAR